MRQRGRAIQWKTALAFIIVLVREEEIVANRKEMSTIYCITKEIKSYHKSIHGPSRDINRCILIHNEV